MPSNPRRGRSEYRDADPALRAGDYAIKKLRKTQGDQRSSGDHFGAWVTGTVARDAARAANVNTVSRLTKSQKHR